MPKKRKHNRQRRRLNGGALISALFITAIAAIIAVALIVQQNLLIHESELVLSADQSYLNLQGIALYGKNEVEKYAMQWANPAEIPASVQPLKKHLPSVTVGDETLTGTIDDEQGKFNLNNLIYTANQPLFVTLLRSVVQGISKETAYNIAQAITAWLSNDLQDPYYLSLHPPYRAPQHEMANVSELRLVNGISPTIYSALAPNVTALPLKMQQQQQQQQQQTETFGSNAAVPIQTVTPVNINSASAPVLMTTNPAMTLSQAEDMVSCRKQHGYFSNTSTFIADCGVQSGITVLNNITTKSRYFLVDVHAISHTRSVTLRSLLVTHITKNNKLKVVTVWQSFE